MLHKELDNTGLFIANLIRRSFNLTSEHHSCSDECCIAHQIDDKTNQTQHADDCPGIPMCYDIFCR